MSETEQTSVTRKALARVLEAFDRADELGGDMRDRLVQRYHESERLQSLVGKLNKLRGKKSDEIELPPTPAEKAAEAADDESDVVLPEQTGMGDPGVAAQVYGKSSCPWTGRAIRLLEDRKVDYDFVDMDDDDNVALETPLVAETKQNTVPYVYLRGKFIGGFNALDEVDRLGQLEVAVMDAEERAKHEARDPAKIEIAARENTDEVAPGEVETPEPPSE